MLAFVRGVGERGVAVMLAPFGGKLLIGKRFNEGTSDYTSSLKANLLACFSAIPVRQWNTARAFVGPAIDRVDNGVGVTRLAVTCSTGRNFRWPSLRKMVESFLPGA